jgi:hypothetical protein
MLHAIAGPCATLADLREGTYLSGRGKLWYVLGALGDESVVIEDCALPDEPECWPPTLFLATWGPLEVVKG